MARAGWYNDEWDPQLARWHDGTAWTEHVVFKADWEARGYAPPPPEPAYGGYEQYDGYDDDYDDEVVGAGLYRGRRAVAGTVAVLALMVAGGVALGQGDGDDDPAEQPASEQVDRAAERDAGTASSLDPLEVTTTVEPSAATAGDDAGMSEARSATTRSSSRTGGTSPTSVRRTETKIQTSTNTGPQTSVGPPEDKTSVGNSTKKSITDGYVPPPPTEPTSTTPTSPPDSTPPSPPPDDGTPDNGVPQGT